VLRSPRPRPDDGLSLIELLITVAVLGVVLAGFSRILRTESQIMSQTGRNLAIRDSLSQASDLMSREIAMASRLSTDPSTLPGSSICKSSAPNPVLVLIGPNNGWQITYGLRSATAAEMTNDWFGPGLLIRCGPSYSASLGTGRLDTSSTITKSVVLDRLNASTGFSASLGSSLGSGSSLVNQSASITLNLVNDMGNTISSSFQTRIAANALYNMSNYPTLDCPASNSYNCTDSATSNIDNYVLPSTAINNASIPTLTITPTDTSKEVIMYLPGQRDDYTNDTSCNVSQCIIGGKLTLKNFSLLVFKDQEIRLSPQ
jgi:prepilin-type N-terminal cleavage/methylation domain-containing protein